MRHLIRFFVLAVAIAGFVSTSRGQDKQATFTFTKGDRVAWVGSSSTNIGVWPKTMEFLLRTRQPELQLQFKKFSTGGGTFATGLQNLDKWLDDFQPTVVILNFGGNDANAGEKGLAKYKENMEACVAKIEAKKACVAFTSFQGADVRKAGEEPAARRKIYADAQLAFCKEKGWPIVDVFRPTTDLQQHGQKDDDKFTILRDKIHLTDPAYIAWGYYLYDGLRLPAGVSELAIDVKALRAIAEVGCKVDGLEIRKDFKSVRFSRIDRVLPILPPGALPPRAYVPLEKHSPYLLRINGLPAGSYDIHCEKIKLGAATDAELAKGVNLNSMVLTNAVTPPWADLAKQIWAGKELDQIGKTRWIFRVEAK
ncbi:MAG: hypothetical protein EXS16_00045 [Gemmataceae bacterium]|nr:hypothetical protein [Gemmataceae bacterium]